MSLASDHCQVGDVSLSVNVCSAILEPISVFCRGIDVFFRFGSIGRSLFPLDRPSAKAMLRGYRYLQ